MPDKISLLDELKKGGYEASLITTYNAYLPFYEEVVLRRLVNSGVRHNVLMMDARQYAQSFSTQPPQLAGRSYTLMPVKVGGAFHPKLVFLAGKNKGLVLVGSHNMTLAGFGFNREITNVVRIENAQDLQGIALAQDIWTEIDFWLESFVDEVPEQLRNMVRKVRDFAPWLNVAGDASKELKLLAGRPGADSLWGQLTGLLEGDTETVSLSGAFFDRRLQFLDRVNRDLQPKKYTVAVDPDTVQFPPEARSLSSASLVRADDLGMDGGKENVGNRYLHAKGIFIEQRDGGAVFASGSANPSAPAWLASAANGNVELMLALRGESARVAARDTGFNLIAEMPALSDLDWQAIESTDQQQPDQGPVGFRSGIAVVDETSIEFDRRMLAEVSEPTFVLRAIDGTEIERTDQSRTDENSYHIEFSQVDLARGCALEVVENLNVILKLLLHHVREVEEQAKSGMQRRFKEALLSLETESPNFELLMQCIDKIVFSDTGDAQVAQIKKMGARVDRPAEEAEAPDSLAIDIDDMKHNKSRHRLKHSSDFAYLLDALIYHLGVKRERPTEVVDRFGRTEEEQTDTDDSDQDIGEASRQQAEILKVCHTRVSTLISRMIAHLNGFAKGAYSLEIVLVRLLAVLAVIRELRNLDGRVSWVESGNTTVPLELRRKLLDEVMFNLFEGEKSLLRLDKLGHEFQSSDDVARLKGLVLWLAWECRLVMDLKKPFQESSEKLRKRLTQNATVLSLAQIIQSDPDVLDEAENSIRGITPSEMNWLKDIHVLAVQCDTFRANKSVLHPASKAEPGDIAIHRNLQEMELRLVSNRGPKFVSLVKLGKGDSSLKYSVESFLVARLQ